MKNIISITSLLVAGTALANAEMETVSLMDEVPTDISVIFKSGRYIGNTLSGIDPSSGNYVEVGSAQVKSLFDGSIVWINPNSKITTSGWWLGTGTNVQAEGFETDAALSVTDGTATFSTRTRPNYKSEYVAFVYDLSNFSGAVSGSYTSDDTLNLSLSYNASGAPEAQITLWYIDAENSVFLLGADGVGTDKTISRSIAYSDNGKILALFSNSSTSTDTNYSSVSLVASIPEPSAFGLLAGLGALALAASRRRRSRK